MLIKAEILRNMEEFLGNGVDLRIVIGSVNKIVLMGIFKFTKANGEVFERRFETNITMYFAARTITNIQDVTQYDLEKWKREVEKLKEETGAI